MSDKRTRSAAVIGSTRGIGLSLAREFAARQWNVAVTGRDHVRATEVAAEIASSFGVSTIGRGLDVGDIETLHDFANEVESRLQSIDVVVFCAGILGPIGPMSVHQSKDFERCLKTNVGGFFNTATSFIPPEPRVGRHLTIVALSGGGLGGDSPLVEAPAYVPSKAAVTALAEVLAPVAATRGASINVIAPGNVPTTFLEDVVKAGPAIAGERFYREAIEHRTGDGSSAISRLFDMINFLGSPGNESINGRFMSARWDDTSDLSLRQHHLGSGDLRLRRIDGERYSSV